MLQELKLSAAMIFFELFLSNYPNETAYLFIKVEFSLPLHNNKTINVCRMQDGYKEERKTAIMSSLSY